MRARSVAVFAALLLAGCNVVLGLEDHEPFPPGSAGGANGAAAENGQGGSSASSQGAHANAGTGQGASSSQGGSAFGGSSNGGSGQGASSSSGNGQGAMSQSGTGQGASSQGGSGQGASSQGGSGQTGGASQGGGTSSGGSSAAGGSSSTGGSGNGTGTGGSGTGATSQGGSSSGGASSNACHDGVPAEGQPCFDTVSITTGAPPKKTLVADFDRDGRDDAFVLEQNAQFELFTSQGTSFAASASGVLVSDLLDGAVGHLDGGSYPDVVVARAGNGTDPMDLCVILNRLDPMTNATTCLGSLSPTFVLDSPPQAMALADVTGDGFDDVVLLDQAGRLRVLRNDGTGAAFTDYQMLAAGSGPLFLAVGDVNHTGTIDAVVASAGDRVVGLWSNSGSSLSPPATTASKSTGNQPVALAIGFLEGTAFQDFAIPDASDGSLWIYPDIGGILATPHTKPFALTNPSAIVIGDLDGDAHADLAVARTAPAELDLVLQPTFGTYVSYSPGFALPGAPVAAIVGDANGDMIADPFVTVPAANSVTVLLSAP